MQSSATSYVKFHNVHFFCGEEYLAPSLHLFFKRFWNTNVYLRRIPHENKWTAN